MYKMRIKLLSDLCAAGGDGYASVIDTDIVTDSFGIPFIPARRLKGCLREAAEYIGTEHIDEIFGVPGNDASAALKVGNANIEEHEELVKELEGKGLDPMSVTELFTDTAASTAVEESGEAKENSLRFMRAVDKRLPWDTGRNIVFCSDIEIADIYKDELEKACKALRHIGSKRTRGFGAVKCTLEQAEKKTSVSVELPEDLDPQKRYVLEYAVRLDENLMLPGTAADKTADFIGGQAVIGMLAREYLRSNKADGEFERLFLEADVKYSNLYITDEKLAEYIPVPAVFGKIKGEDGGLADMTDSSVIEGKIVKPLKSGYISGSLGQKTVDTEIVYHNALKTGSGLYTQLCIRKGQIFRGSVTADGERLRTVGRLLENAAISFGRSKTAQYSGCTLIAAEVREAEEKKLRVKAGEIMLYAFESDAVISDDCGNISPSVYSAAKALDIDPDDILPISVLKYRTVAGFLSVMKLQKAHLRGIAAGSVIAVKSGRDTECDNVMYIGERQNEGYGKIRIFKPKELDKSLVSALTANAADVCAGRGKISEMLSRIDDQKKMLSEAIDFARRYSDEFSNSEKWNPAFIGRVTLMTEESEERIDLDKRISSIKTEKKREVAKDLLKHSESNHYRNWSDEKEYLLLILQLAKYIVKQREGAEK